MTLDLAMKLLEPGEADKFLPAAGSEIGTKWYTGPCRTLRQMFDTVKACGKDPAEVVFWTLSPTPEDQRAAAMRLGIKPTYVWDDWFDAESRREKQ